MYQIVKLFINIFGFPYRSLYIKTRILRFITFTTHCSEWRFSVCLLKIGTFCELFLSLLLTHIPLRRWWNNNFASHFNNNDRFTENFPMNFNYLSIVKSSNFPFPITPSLNITIKQIVIISNNSLASLYLRLTEWNKFFLLNKRKMGCLFGGPDITK